jgi:Lon protease-like protein
MGPLVELPLFPLQTVLIPGMSLPLRIFEPRYRRLLHDCQAADRRFGVVLIRDGHEVGDTAVPHDVGTVAEIVSATPLGDDTFKVATTGRQRFRIAQLHHDRPYLWCEAEILDDPLGEPGAARSFDVRVRALTVDYVAAIYGLAGQVDRRPHVTLPDDPLALSHAVAMLLRVPAEETQTLLEATTVAARLALEVDFLRRELAILQRMLEGRPRRG